MIYYAVGYFLFRYPLQIRTFATVITLNSINFEFGGRYLYKDASWQINPGEKIGLVGRNGTGKSTLLRIINGEYSIESGEINSIRGLTIGFLNQDLLSFSSEDSVEQVALGAFEEALNVEKEIEAILHKLEQGDESQALLERLHDLQMRFEQLDGYRIRQRTAEDVAKQEELAQQFGKNRPAEFSAHHRPEPNRPHRLQDRRSPHGSGSRKRRNWISPSRSGRFWPSNPLRRPARSGRRPPW